MLATDDDQFHFRYGAIQPTFRDSEFHGGKLTSDYQGAVINCTNCLFERVNISIYSEGTGPSGFRNNTLIGGSLQYGSANAAINDNILDNTSLNISGSYTASHNAYVNANGYTAVPGDDAPIPLTASPAYKVGPFGNYYLDSANNPSLIDQGSTIAPLVGLYHYCTITNLFNGTQQKETYSVVDVGYHHLALDSANILADYDGDGIPDYLEDTNGNGQVDTGESNWQTSINGLTSSSPLDVFTPLK